MPKDQNLNDFDANSNPFFNILKEVTSLHRSVVVKNTELLNMCKSKGVKFEDIPKYLLNQAKKAGLYRKTVYIHNEDPSKVMTYPTVKSLKNISWYVAMKNFTGWVTRNYVDYGVKSVRIAKSNTVAKTIVVNKAEPFDNRKPKSNVGGQMAEPPQSAEEIIEQDAKEPATPSADASSTPKGDGSTGNQKPEAPKIINTKDLPSPTLNRPIEASLSLADKQALLIRNRSVMKDMAIEKDAQEEWNLFCEAMEWSDMMIEGTKLQVVVNA